MKREHWVTHEQLDTPLNKLFPDTRTKNTARQYVFICELLLNLPLSNLKDMEYEDMNRHMDRLDLLMQGRVRNVYKKSKYKRAIKRNS